LAELYTQQGLFNDARAQYKQVAEEFLRTGELEQAVRIFQKILEMDPENVAMRAKLAEVYLRLGKKTDAWQIFSAAAESLRARGANGAAEEIVQRMLTLDPANSQALLLRGEMMFQSGNLPGAIEHLQKVADLDSHPEGLRSLYQSYLQTNRLGDAATLAAKLLSVHNDTDALLAYCDALIAAGKYEDALEQYDRYSDRLLAANSAKVLDTLHALIGHVRTNILALETVQSLLNKSGDNTHLTEVYELLAHGCVQSGQLEKARDYYLKLTQLEPQNQLHANNYQQVVSRLGGSSGSSLITVEEGATLVDELEATAPFVDQRYSDDVALSVRAALTDAELFASYNMPAKALGPLMAALPLAPQDLRLNQRLAALHTRAGKFAEAAVCCRTLETIYHEAGYPDEATRYGELAAKYEERSSAQPVELSHWTPGAGPEAAAPTAKLAFEPALSGASETSSQAAVEAVAEPAPAPAPSRAPGLFWHAPAAQAPAAAKSAPAPEAKVAAEEPVTSEIDLSEEWEGALTVDAPAPAAAAASADHRAARGSRDAESSAEVIAATVAEIRFYLTHSMLEQARSALVKLEQLGPDAETLAALEDEVSAATTRSAFAGITPAEEVAVVEDGDIVPEPAEAEEPAQAEAARIPDAVASSAPQRIAFDPGPTPIAAPPHTAWPEPPAAPAAQASAETQDAGLLSDFVADLESSLGDSFMAPTSPAAARPAPLGAGHSAAPPSAREVGLAASASASFGAPLSAPPLAASESQAQASTFSIQPRPLPTPGSGSASVDPSLGIDLAGMFGELRQELEEDTSAAAGEDPETHYNLGVAFREMGLLDEAIGELQKVCQAVEHGHKFPHVMQTYTWLAQCFLDKGVPEAAIRWYERALTLPKLDSETRMALHYELAAAHEAAQNKPAALKHFLEVYGSNIDYRDVAERIKALKS
jgi:tetratricopeptide (TPR) repeat protein